MPPTERRLDNLAAPQWLTLGRTYNRRVLHLEEVAFWLSAKPGGRGLEIQHNPCCTCRTNEDAAFPLRVKGFVRACRRVSSTPEPEILRMLKGQLAGALASIGPRQPRDGSTQFAAFGRPARARVMQGRRSSIAASHVGQFRVLSFCHDHLLPRLNANQGALIFAASATAFQRGISFAT
jgi:hypothetical protein